MFDIRFVVCVSAEVLKEIITQKDLYLKQEDGSQKKRALISIQRGLIKSQELGDEKLQLVSQILEHIENRTRQLEQDLENLGLCGCYRQGRFIVFLVIIIVQSEIVKAFNSCCGPAN